MSAKHRRPTRPLFFKDALVRRMQRVNDEIFLGNPAIPKDLPHYVLYSLAGFILGLLSPIGAFLLRWWLLKPLLLTPWAIAEIRANFIFYSYMAIGTATVFMAFGYSLGLRSETQNVRARAFKARLSELRLKSVTDSLTGAYSHGYLQEALKFEAQKSLALNHQLSIAMIDLDDFKKINDERGHLFGDRTVKETAETISASIRSEDILGRYGGDEFLVIMPRTDIKIAQKVAERIRQNIAQNHYLATVSIGLSSRNIKNKTEAAKMIDEADQNLYRAKKRGKNTIEISDLDLPEAAA